jgi:methionyl-tRNA formyltransferase
MSDTPARVIFMGTPDFAVPSLQALATGPFEIVGVVTQPDRPQGRKRILAPPPVKQAAEALGLPVFQPEKVRAEASLKQLAALRPDVLVTAAYGQILPQKLLDIPRVGCINVHASLLPRWRGAAPIHRAILAGDTETGVTLMEMVAALDAGPVLGAVRVPILPEDNVGTLHDRLAQAGAALLRELLPAYLRGEIQPTPQPKDGVTYADRILRKDEWLDWSQSVRTVFNHIRGLSPWPGAATRWRDGDLKVWAAALPASTAAEAGLPPASDAVQPGCAVMRKDGVFVRCGDGWVELREVQPSGRRRMSAADWFRGTGLTELQFAVRVEGDEEADKGGPGS